MAETIRLRVTRPESEPGSIEGFLSLWAFYVDAFNPDVHCQRCFHGANASNFNTRNACTDTDYLFDRIDAFPYLYLCGVGAGKKDERHRTNLHFPLRYEAGAVAEGSPRVAIGLLRKARARRAIQAHRASRDPRASRV